MQISIPLGTIISFLFSHPASILTNFNSTWYNYKPTKPIMLNPMQLDFNSTWYNYKWTANLILALYTTPQL